MPLHTTYTTYLSPIFIKFTYALLMHYLFIIIIVYVFA